MKQQLKACDGTFLDWPPAALCPFIPLWSLCPFGPWKIKGQWHTVALGEWHIKEGYFLKWLWFGI
jgi:hypothetical protein